MKKIILLLSVVLFVSCSADEMQNCEEAIEKINSEIDNQISWVQENTSPVDTQQISLLEQERSIRIDSACE